MGLRIRGGQSVQLMPALMILLAACATPAEHRADADRVALDIIAEKQEEALGRTEEFTVEPPAETLRLRLLRDQNLPVAGDASFGSGNLVPPGHWPEVRREDTAVEAAPPPWEGGGPATITLLEALQVGARNSREYQGRKEELFRTALRLDLERDDFRNTFAGLLQGLLSSDGGGEERVAGARGTAEGSVLRRLKSGGEITARIALDLVRLLTQDRSSSLGIFGDATLTIPLMRGAGEHIVLEPLTQAERDVVYALWEFERFKREFAVEVASSYLAVLQQRQEVENSAENYRGLITSSNRARRLAEAGRLPGFQYDQALQNELRARDRWIAAQESYARRLDSFKLVIGLPADAELRLDPAELRNLADLYRGRIEGESGDPGEGEVPPADAPVALTPPGRGGAGPYELEESKALDLALERRLDLKVALGRVEDAQREVVVAADALRGELTLFGSAAAGERRTVAGAGRPDAVLSLEDGFYTALLTADLPLERTAERNAFRESFIGLEAAVRDAQGLEDRVKSEVRERLRRLLESREGMKIQAGAVAIAERRVRSTDLFLQAGRAEIRDVLESREALINAQNALTAALVGYRVAELELQRDLGVLEVDAGGIWKEYDLLEAGDGRS